MKNRLLSITLTLLMTVTAVQAQHFEWARGFVHTNNISVIGTVTDSLGNLYLLGDLDGQTFNGEDFLPFGFESKAVVIAKISPQGEIVWKKAVFGNSNAPLARDIKPLGDTGFAVMFDYAPSNPEVDPSGWWLYWLDTMYTTEFFPFSPYEYDDHRLSFGVMSAYVAFDFDGNVTEQHSLLISYVDNYGEDIVQQYYPDTDSLPYILAYSLKYGCSFDVDNSGNIYICREAWDDYFDYRADLGTISAVKYWVDNRLVGVSTVENNPELWRPHLLKFSPHFNALETDRYIFQECIPYGESWYTFHIKYNHNTNQLYVTSTVQFIGDSFDKVLVLDSTTGLAVHCYANENTKSFITVHDPLLNPTDVIQLQHFGSSQYIVAEFHDICFDHDSNLVAISGNVASDNNSVFRYDTTILPMRGDAFVLLLNQEDFSLHSIGIVPSLHSSQLYTAHCNNLAMKNNRVFVQTVYNGGIQLADRVIDFHNQYISGLCLLIFDYQGNVIGGADYSTLGRPGPLSLRDSNLYLFDYITEDASYGEHYLPVNGGGVGFAKYVDTAFMTVYVPPAPSVGVEPPSETAVYVYPNPARDMLRIDLGGGSIAGATATSMLGQTTALRAKGDTVDLSILPPGVYILEITAENGARHTAKVLKQ